MGANTPSLFSFLSIIAFGIYLCGKLMISKEASAMKMYLRRLMKIVGMASIGFAAGLVCIAGTCDRNIMTRISIEVAESGKGQTGKESEVLIIEWLQTNCTTILGVGNGFLQSNTACVYGITRNQIQDNIAMALGSSNKVDQESNAFTTGVSEVAQNSSNMNQPERSAYSLLTASNKAMIYPVYPNEQIRNNEGLFSGNENWQVLCNNIMATMFKDTAVDFFIKQNVAFAMNNIDDRELDTTDTNQFCWSFAIYLAASLPAISCPEGGALQIARAGSNHPSLFKTIGSDK